MWRSFAFIACMGGAHALKMEQGLFPGRVGDIVFTQQPAAEQRTHLVLLGAGAQAGPSTMPETAVAPLAAHIAGALPTAFEAALPDVAVHVAAPTPALLTLALEGLTLAELRADAADFARIGGLVDGGHAVQLEASFAPRDRVAAAVCRATGATPASHGVPSKAWLDPSGELVAAFTAGKRETASRVASVADVVGQASGGRALILSVSSDAQLAAAAGAHPSTSAAWPAAVVSYDAETGSLVPAAAADAAVSALGSAALLTVTQAEAREALRRVAAAELAALDAAAPSPAAAAALVAELGGSLALLGRLAAEPRTAALLADRSTDVVTLSLAALAPLKAEPAARRLVDAAVPALLAAYAAASGAGARAQLLLAPADTDGAHAAGAALAAVEGWTVVGAHAFAAATATDAAKLAGCEAFAAQAAGSALTAHCLVGRPRGASGGRRLKQTASSAAAEEPLQTVQYTSDQLELFQVTLWSTVILLIALLAGSCVLYNMEVTQDSLLFGAKSKAA